MESYRLARIATGFSLAVCVSGAAWAEVRKLSDLPIKYLTSTHFHPEHGFGAQVFTVWKRASELRAQGILLADAQQAISTEMIAAHPDWKEPHWISNAVERVYAESPVEQ